MAKYLAIFSDTLNEIEVKGFVTMTDKEMERFEELATSITWNFEYPLGEEIIYFESGEDLLTRLDFKEISNDEYKALKKVFNNEFGVFIDEEFLTNILSDSDEDDFDDEDEDEDDDYEDRDYNDRRKGSKYDDEFDDDY